MPLWNTLNLPDSASPLMAQLHFFHDHALVILTLTMVLVSYWLVSTLSSQQTDRLLLESQSVEVVWTVVPMVILVFLALPSLRLLYLLDEVKTPDLTVKVVGSQWYWSYEYSDFPGLEFDSYMVSGGEPHLPRLLEVDNRLTLPQGLQLRFVVTATDVIHSWTVPTLGVKADAVPGRLNQISSKLALSGLFYGQCSEICGANHSFMPIVVESVSPEHFASFAG